MTIRDQILVIIEAINTVFFKAMREFWSQRVFGWPPGHFWSFYIHFSSNSLGRYQGGAKILVVSSGRKKRMVERSIVLLFYL